MHILIIEDEPKIARFIEKQLRELLSDRLSRLSRVQHLEEARCYLEEKLPDLVLLDLNLNGKDGFDLLKDLTSYAFQVIVISAYQERAIEAFEFGILDFIPKPFIKSRLQKALDRAEDSQSRSPGSLKYLGIRKKNSVLVYPLDQLVYIQAANTYSELFFWDDTKELHHKSLNSLEKLLPPFFVRVHKSYMINRHYLRELISLPGAKYLARMKNGREVPIGRTRFKDLKNQLY